MNPELPLEQPMDADNILEKYSLTKETATRYIDAITHMNQTEAAEKIDVSRDTINRYKDAFQEMKPRERLLLIATLTHERLLGQCVD